MNFRDEYEKQVLEDFERLDKLIFPEEMMEAFRMSAEADVAAGRNRCERTGEVTMLRIYPSGAWINQGDLDSLHRSGGIPGHQIAFDMTPLREKP